MVTTSNSTGSGPVQVWPAGTTRPVAVTHTTAAGETLSNTTIAAMSADGKLSVVVDGGVDTDLRLSVTGYFTQDRAGAGYAAHAPTTSTRSVGAAGTETFDVADTADAADGKQRTQGDVQLVTVRVDAATAGVLKLGPVDGATSELVYPAGRSTSMVTTTARDTGVQVTNAGTDPATVTLTAQGWFGAAASDGGFHPAGSRLADTRQAPEGGLAASGVREVSVLGREGVPTSDVGAAVVAITVLDPAGDGQLTASTFGGTGTVLDYTAGQARTVVTTVALQGPPTGAPTLRVANSSLSPTAPPVNVTVDLVGWFDSYQQVDVRTDGDADDLPDEVEVRLGLTPGSSDSDGDGLTDGQEILAGSDPARADSNGNGVPDSAEDPDHDGVTNAVEAGDRTLAYRADTDGDTLTDGREKQLRTNPLAADTDGDGLPDGDEVAVGSDPLLASSGGDGVGDAQRPHTTTIAPSGTQISFTATGPGAAVTSVQVRQPTDERLAGTPGQLSAPVEVIAPSPLSSGTLQIPFDTDGLASDAEVAVLHFDETTGTFDRPANQTINRTTGLATVTTNTFSPFIVVNYGLFTEAWKTRLAPPRSPDSQTRGLDIVADLASAGSVPANDPLGDSRTAAKTLVDGPLPADRVGIVNYNNGPQVLRALTADKAAVKASIDGINSIGGTDITGGFRLSLDHLDQQGIPGNDRVVVLLTDGAGGYDSALTARAKASRTTVYTVGLGSTVNTVLLQDIAAQTGGTYYPVSQATGLGDAFKRISDEVAAKDTDGDGLSDPAETNSWRDGAGRIYQTDPAKADTDGDGLTDGEEAGGYSTAGSIGEGTYYRGLSNPTVVDTDSDGLEDGQEADLETRPRIADSDFDGLDDLTEVDQSLDPLEADGDHDGLADGEELQQGSDPYLYDCSRDDSAWAFFVGLILGGDIDPDGWKGKALHVTIDIASCPTYLVGNIASGLVAIGDARDFIYAVGTGAWGDALISATAVIPVGGDALKAVKLSASSPNGATRLRSAHSASPSENWERTPTNRLFQSSPSSRTPDWHEMSLSPAERRLLATLTSALING